MNGLFCQPKAFWPLCLLLLLLLLVSVPLTVLLGTVPISPQDITSVIIHHITSQPLPLEISKGVEKIIWDIRLPRVIMACLTGMGLAVAGLTLQGVTKNTLADPHLLGISAGAVLGAVIVTMHIGEVWGAVTLPIAAFVGAMLSTGIIVSMSHQERLSSPTHLLMCGVALSFVLLSASNFFLFLGDHRATHQVVFWTLGGLGLSRWSTLALPFFICFSGYIYLHFNARYINALLIGDETAISLGINVKVLRSKLFVVSALITSVLVANSGAIGFVGLMIPHIGRYFVGGSTERLLPFCALAGALFLPWVDVLARTLLAPEELPIGVITGFVGGLFFIALFVRTAK
ncbi:MAG: iron ABC transporter permease [Flavobacteriales bacterium]|nr:iron ABC transporter permease [Flavobacteriales bacterium]